MSVKYYSNKSNAKRAALAAGLDLEACELLANGTGYAYVAKQANVAPAMTSDDLLAALPAHTYGAADYGIPATPGPTEAPVAQPTAALALVQAITEAVEAGVAAEEAPAAPRKAVIVEKNREERNDVARPSLGGICRAIWDACDTQVASGGKATVGWIKVYGAAQGWNKTTVTIQFYQWRKFNGISGRQA